MPGIITLKPSVLVLAGPTAVGKTALSVKLAQALEAEIISADSMQVYKGMDIGTAKASLQERAGVPHHMLDVADPAQDFSVAEYVRLAQKSLDNILGRGKVPLICGGTGFYIQALLKGLVFSESISSRLLRDALEKRMEEEGPAVLHQELSLVDPEAAAAIHPHNRKRVIRALEYYQEKGEKISDLNLLQAGQESPYRVLYLVLTLPRQTLYQRIEKRVDDMLTAGLLQEVRGLLAQGVPPSSTAMQGLGYKEILAYEEGLCTLEEAAARICLGSRHYAKRQLTWFKREKDALWLDKSDYPNEEALFSSVLAMCCNFLHSQEEQS